MHFSSHAWSPALLPSAPLPFLTNSCRSLPPLRSPNPARESSAASLRDAGSVLNWPGTLCNSVSNRKGGPLDRLLLLIGRRLDGEHHHIRGKYLASLAPMVMDATDTIAAVLTSR